VALLTDDRVLSRRAEPGRTHAQQILGMVQSLLAEAELSLTTLDGLVASIGPGAFTGVRITVAVAQGLAFGADLRVVPVTTLEALAFAVMRGNRDRAVACLDARMGEVYWGCFEADERRGLAAAAPACVGSPDSVELPLPGTYRGIGRGFAAYPQLAALPRLVLEPSDVQAVPDATQFARIGALRFKLGAGVDPADLDPLYLRDKVALTEAERARK
jgi:tRNA threonylcarbamoyladenosine biosynthesis protein TsaB